MWFSAQCLQWRCSLVVECCMTGCCLLYVPSHRPGCGRNPPGTSRSSLVDSPLQPCQRLDSLVTEAFLCGFVSCHRLAGQRAMTQLPEAARFSFYKILVLHTDLNPLCLNMVLDAFWRKKQPHHKPSTL